MTEKKISDISPVLNEIISALQPIYDDAENEGEQAVAEFLSAIFAASAKLCIELDVNEKQATTAFKNMWKEAVRSLNQDLN